MVSRIDIGPENGPFVELDEDSGDFVVRVPNNLVDFDDSDIDSLLVVSNAETAEPATPATGELARWYDSTDESYKAKFDDGSTVTIAQK